MHLGEHIKYQNYAFPRKLLKASLFIIFLNVINIIFISLIVHKLKILHIYQDYIIEIFISKTVLKRTESKWKSLSFNSKNYI